MCPHCSLTSLCYVNHSQSPHSRNTYMMAIIDKVLIGLILPFHVRCSTKMYISRCPHWISYYNDNYKCPDSTIAQNLICFQSIYGILKFALRVCTTETVESTIH